MSEQAIAVALVEARGVTRVFKSGTSVVHALRGVDLRLLPGEFVVLRGRSGAGKTTLLTILSGLDAPTSGSVMVLGRELTTMPERERTALRGHGVGVMLQNAHLFPSLTALENVEIPLRLMRMEPVERTKRAILALEQVHLGARLCIRGLELSGSEQQRVALARALVHGPQLLVADEPTGILDSMTGREFILLLREIAHGSNVGVLVATHDPAVVSVADRVLDINDGRITQEQ